MSWRLFADDELTVIQEQLKFLSSFYLLFCFAAALKEVKYMCNLLFFTSNVTL